MVTCCPYDDSINTGDATKFQHIIKRIFSVVRDSIKTTIYINYVGMAHTCHLLSININCIRVF